MGHTRTFVINRFGKLISQQRERHTRSRRPLIQRRRELSWVGPLALTFMLGSTFRVVAQAIPTASRTANVQIGVGFSTAKPDYVQQRFPGFAIYADFDPRPHWGIEAEFHQVYSTNGDLSLERTYEIGGRYMRTYGHLVPYIKGMYGRGDFRYPFGYTELGYNIFAGGGGADITITRYIHARAEYEYQKWISFPNGGFTPQLLTFGVAYHFDGKPRFRQ